MNTSTINQLIESSGYVLIPIVGVIFYSMVIKKLNHSLSQNSEPARIAKKLTQLSKDDEDIKEFISIISTLNK